MLRMHQAMIDRPRHVCLAALLAAAAIPAARGQQDSTSVVTVQVVPAAREVPPGAEMVVAVVMEIREGWHINAWDPRLPPELDFFQAIPTTIDVELPEGRGVVAHPDRIQWPRETQAPLAFLGASATYGVYEGTSIAYLPLTVSEAAAPGPVALSIGVGFQACSDTTCLAPSPPRPVTVQLAVATEAPLPTLDQPLFAGYGEEADAPEGRGGGDGDSWFYLLGAVLGGFTLNFMPCVLPVIPIKIMALSQAASNRRRCALLGIAMAAGVVLFWTGLGVAIASLSQLTTINGLFRYPAFTIGIGIFIAVMAVSMCGLFDARLPAWIYALDPSRETLAGAVGYGVMTAVLATPCTAPFMGNAAFWSLGQSPQWVMAIFFAIGAGMALPYVVLTAFPGLLSRIPRTGPGSLLLKQVMGLLMLAGAVYFIGAGASGLLAGDDGRAGRGYWYAVGAVVALSGGWLGVRGLGLRMSAARKGVLVTMGAVLVVTAAVGARALTHPGPIAWDYYTPSRYEAALKEGKAVLLDFTAETCINCKVLEYAVLYDKRVVEVLGRGDVVPMKVDLTGDNPDGWKKLGEVGAVAIPRLVIVDSFGRETINAEIYTVGDVLEAIAAATGRPATSAVGFARPTPAPGP